MTNTARFEPDDLTDAERAMVTEAERRKAMCCPVYPADTGRLLEIIYRRSSALPAS